MTEVTVWSGWIGGIAVGLYGLLQLILSGKPLGVSTGYGNLCAVGSRQPFFCQGPYEERNSWRIWFIIGLPLGGLVAALTSPGPVVASFSVGPMYDSILPSATWAKAVILTGGGILMGLGARMAGGCPSGHSIAGLSLMNWPSALASAGFFVGGIAAVQVMFRLLGA